MTVVYFTSHFCQFKALVHRISKLSSEATFILTSTTLTIYFDHGYIVLPIQACIIDEINIKVNMILFSKSIKNITEIKHINISFNKITIQSKDEKKECIFRVKTIDSLDTTHLIKRNIDLYPRFEIKKLIWICEKVINCFNECFLKINNGIVEIFSEKEEYKVVSHIELSSRNHDTKIISIQTQKLLNIAWILDGVSQTAHIVTDPYTFQIMFTAKDEDKYVSMFL